MKKKAKPGLCPECGEEVLDQFDFCPNCGILFREKVSCTEHPLMPALGVCVICQRPLCRRSLSKVQGRYLCEKHDKLEIYEGMVRVFGTSDAAQASFARTSLESDGLHPVIFPRKSSPLSMGGPEYSLFRASGEYVGHIINEFKLMVPCCEYLDAQEKLHALEIVS